MPGIIVVPESFDQNEELEATKEKKSTKPQYRTPS